MNKPATPGPQADAEATRCAAATLWLMSHYTRRPCPLVAHAVADQLDRLAQYCTDGASQVMRKLAEALLPQWQRIACGSARAVRH